MKAGWEVKPLGEVCEYARGLTYKKADEVERSTKRVLRANNIDREASVLDYSEIRYLREDFEIPSAKKIARGSIIICTASGSKSHLGKVALVDTDQDFAFGGFMGLITPKNGLLPKFLHYAMTSQSYLDFIDQNTDGANINNLKFSQLAGFMFPIPPLEEQKRIVAVLDAAFERLTRAKENAEANLQNARELFESYLADVFSGALEGWKPCTVGDVLTLQRGFDITKKDQKAGTVPVVSSGGARSFHSEAKCRAPGVVIGRKGSIGTVHYVVEDYWPHDTTLWVKDFKGNSPRLVSNLLAGLRLNELDTGAANPSLNRNLVHPLNIFWPHGMDQERISDELEALASSSLSAENEYRTKLTDIADLRQSLLQKAFAGELT